MLGIYQKYTATVADVYAVMAQNGKDFTVFSDYEEAKGYAIRHAPSGLYRINRHGRATAALLRMIAGQSRGTEYIQLLSRMTAF